MNPIPQLVSEIALDARGHTIWGFAFSCLLPLELFVHKLLAAIAASIRGAVPFWSRGYFSYQCPTRLLHPQKETRDNLSGWFNIHPEGEGRNQSFPHPALWVISPLQCEHRVM